MTILKTVNIGVKDEDLEKYINNFAKKNKNASISELFKTALRFYIKYSDSKGNVKLDLNNEQVSIGLKIPAVEEIGPANNKKGLNANNKDDVSVHKEVSAEDDKILAQLDETLKNRIKNIFLDVAEDIK